MRIGKKAASVQPSATLAVSNKAKQLKADGVDMVSFSAGEPDFSTPDRVCDAAKKAIDDGYTTYTHTMGIPELRQAIADAYKKDYGLDAAIDQIVVSCGAKHSIYLALFALLDPGDEVLIPGPYWVSYPHQVRLCDGVPVVVETEAADDFKMSAEKLKAAITDKTKALILNSPSNPTGMLYTKEELAALAEVVEESGIAVICDDIYAKLVYDGLTFNSLVQASEKMQEHCIVINGVSKSAAMTGWRVGYMIAPKEVAVTVSRLQGQMTSHTASIAQYASVEAVAGEEVELPNWVSEFQARRDKMVAELNEIEGVSCAKPQGAFYVFPDWRGLLDRTYNGKKLDDDLAWADYFLDEAHVAMVPGSGFGAKGFLRLSFATSMEKIEEGIKRIKAAVAKTS